MRTLGTFIICVLIAIAIYLMATVPSFGASPHALSNLPAQQMFQPEEVFAWTVTLECSCQWEGYETLAWYSTTNSINWKLEAEQPVQYDGLYRFVDHVYSPYKLYRTSTQYNTNAYNL